jgi:thiamine thiazole synthase
MICPVISHFKEVPVETVISRGIVNSFFRKLDESLEGDVAIVGAGPSGLVAAARGARAR